MLDYAGPDTHSSERGAIAKRCRMVLYSALSLGGVAVAYWAAAANEPVGIACGGFIALMGAAMTVAAYRGPSQPSAVDDG